MVASVLAGFTLEGELSSSEVSKYLEAGTVKSWLFLEKDVGEVEDRCLGKHINFVHVPFDAPSTNEHAQQLVAALDGLPTPAVVQCKSGRRAGAAVLLHVSRKAGLSSEQALSLGSALGLTCASSDALRTWLTEQLSGSTLLFRQLFEKESSTFTYLLADEGTKDAVLIDPVLETVERDLAIVDQLGLNLRFAINTHCHADHITGTGEIKKRRPTVQSGIAKASGARADVLYSHQDVITFGNHTLEVRATPGHTPGCVSYVTSSGGGKVFTGDAVLIGGCGRTDFQGGDAQALYQSVHEQIFTLPGTYTLYPAHAYDGQTSSSVAAEKLHNKRLTKSMAEFVEIMNNLNLPYPKKIDASVPANLKCGVTD